MTPVEGTSPAVLRLPIAAALVAASLTGCAANGAGVDGVSSPALKSIPTGPTGLLRVSDRVAAPVLRGEALDGSPLDVSALRGKVVVLNFWASWCAPCRAESKNLVAVAAQTKASGVAFVGVNIKDDRGAARHFDDVHGVTYPSLFDQQGLSLLRFRSLVPQQPPTTLLLDRQGRIAGRFIQGLTEAELSGPVQVLAKEQA